MLFNSFSPQLLSFFFFLMNRRPPRSPLFPTPPLSRAGEGLPPPPIGWRLHEMGDWMRANGEAIYATSVSPYGMPAWGRYTAKPGRLYAHIFDWPKDQRLPLTGLKDRPLRAYMLADGKPLTIETDSGLAVRLPTVPPSTIASVVVLETSSTVLP